MKTSRLEPRYNKSRYAHLPVLCERDLSKPLGGRRSNPIVPAQLEYLVQPIYDFYAVAVATAVTKQVMFAIPIGQPYTPAGGTVVTKTLFHTNLVQAAQLDPPKKLLVKAVAVVLRSDVAESDLNSFIGLTLVTFVIGESKSYWTAHVAKTPAGGGAFYFAMSTQTLAAGGTMGNSGSNGWPSAQNVATITDDMPQIPGLAPMQPILGQLIEQQQNFNVTLDPTLTGSAGFTTLAAAPATQFVGTGINLHVYLEGVLARGIQ